MRYRALDANGDYIFGQGPLAGGSNNNQSEFLVNSPQCVAQAIQTRLLLMQGEWFLDTTEGTSYATQILGPHTQATYDAAITNRILTTPGVLSLDSYTSLLQPDRSLLVICTVTTQYGQVQVEAPLIQSTATVITTPGGQVVTAGGGEAITI